VTNFQDKWFSWIIFIPIAFLAQAASFKILDFILILYVSFMGLNPESIIYVLVNGAILSAVGSYIYFRVGTSFFTKKTFFAGLILAAVMIFLWTYVAIQNIFWGGSYFLLIYTIFCIYRVYQLKIERS